MFYSLQIVATSQVAKASYIFFALLNVFIRLITDQNYKKQKKCTGFIPLQNKDILGIFQEKKINMRDF